MVMEFSYAKHLYKYGLGEPSSSTVNICENLVPLIFACINTYLVLLPYISAVENPQIMKNSEIYKLKFSLLMH